jgi:hypothetical protein
METAPTILSGKTRTPMPGEPDANRRRAKAARAQANYQRPIDTIIGQKIPLLRVFCAAGCPADLTRACPRVG